MSDSKGFAIKRRIGLNFVEFWCEPGWRTAPAIDFLEKTLKANCNKKYLLYVWLGTCDISVKTGKFSSVRSWDNSAIELILSQYRRLVTILSQYPNSKAKFIEIPCFSVLAYNTSKGHTDPNQFKVHDTEICRQIEELNSAIRAINTSISQQTLPFNCDIKRRRKDINKRKGNTPRVRVSYKFAAYYDGIHADTDLALIWTKRLTDDINANCFKPSEDDILEIHVPEEELNSL